MPDSDFPVPPDVPAYVPRTANWLANGLPTYGTPGTEPYLANEPVDPNPANLSTYGPTSSGYMQYDNNFTASGQFKTAAQGATQSKMRTIISPSHVGRFDPVRAYGVPDAGHWHIFFGPQAISPYSTFKSLRYSPTSTNAGGPLNNTAYWIPAMLQVVSGQTFARIPDLGVVYYAGDVNSGANLSRLMRGIRYVTGYNMEDPTNSAIIAELNVNGGYATNPVFNGFNGWKMVAADGATAIPTSTGQSFSPCLKNLDGSDPWGGAAGPGAKLFASLDGPQYWDGQNPWSPGGYKHFRHNQRHGNSGQVVGPHLWFKVPGLQITFSWTHQGFSDYGTWSLSSDPAGVAPGTSMHADWFNGWESQTQLLWQTNGLGVGGNTPHEMDDSVMSNTQRLIVYEAAPNGRNPQVDIQSYRSVLLPTGSPRGPMTARQKAG